MNRNKIYFLAVLVDALNRPDPKRSIKRAFEKIIRHGRDPKYMPGLVQFHRFMAEVENNWDKNFHDGTEAEAPGRKLNIIIERNGKEVTSFPIDSKPMAKKIKGIKPSNYTVRLDTGRTLWQSDIHKDKLLWTEAFLEKKLALAADTGDLTAIPTREITLLNGEMVIRIFPELESGYIEIKIGPSNLEY